MLHRSLGSLIKTGCLRIIWPGGRVWTLGTPGQPGAPDVTLQVTSRRTALRIMADPEMQFGEAYMNGDVTFTQGTLDDLLELYGQNKDRLPQRPGLWRRLSAWAGRAWQQRNARTASRRNVAHHYDLSTTLYRQFLDDDLHYSCAYFARPEMSLEEAQQAKIVHLASKLRLAPGQRVLDIGSGWGSLAMGLARRHDVAVEGVTLSREQLQVAQQRAEAAGLSDRVSFRLKDYRDQTGRFDRIVSVGMFEHVGAPQFETFFAKVRSLLRDDGVAVIHAIGSMAPPGTTNRWIRKYIFPGGYVPALSETLAAVERAGLWVTDIEILRLHYAETCRQWRARFQAHLDLVREIYDERFVRMWDFYLAVSEMGFRYGGLMVFQIQLAKAVDTLPIVRGYMVEAERAESAVRPASA